MRNYDLIAYENYYFWLINIVREWGMFDHGIDTKLVDGLCGCFVCARSVVQIMQEYVDQCGGNVVNLMNRMVKATEQLLSKYPHGFRPDVCYPHINGPRQHKNLVNHRYVDTW